MNSNNPEKKIDRRLLGDKWLDWNGDPAEETTSADTAVTVSLSLAGMGIVLFIGILVLLWYLVFPRFEQFHPAAPWAFGALVAVLSLFLLALGGSVILTIATGRNFLLIRRTHRFLLGAVTILQHLGKKLGIPADRVSNSLLKVNNALIFAVNQFSGKERLLLLLPRCLTKEVRQEILKAAESRGLTHATCSGGEDARKKILLEKPDLVVAVACERDLVAGIRDARASLPVIGIPNSRPRGPCKCTEINVESLVKVFSHIKGNEKEAALCDKS